MLTHLLEVLSLLLEGFPRIVIIFTAGELLFYVFIILQIVHNLFSWQQYLCSALQLSGDFVSKSSDLEHVHIQECPNR